METFVNWLAKKSPPWADYGAFMLGRLNALDKQPGVFLVGVGGTWRHLFDKIVLNVTVPEATMACHNDQICAVIKAGIGGVVHRVQAIWYGKLTTEDWEVMLV